MKWFILISILLCNLGYADSSNPIIVNAIISKTDITFSPNTIPENTPFIIHITNNSSMPVELENTDTSVEVYADTDKTFKVGLTAGAYVFFNDFNPSTKAAPLFVKTGANITHAIQTQAALTAVLSNNASKTKSFFSSEDLSILFIIWRESVEALLVVGIIYGWLKHTKTAQKSGFLFLSLGVGLGLLCAMILSAILVDIHSLLSPSATNYFQACMSFIAALMIVYMVKWMRNNSRALKPGMHNALEKHAAIKWRNISILIVTAVAFAREASEAVIFIYALGFGTRGESAIKMLSISLSAVALAIITISLLRLGNKLFSWRFFFKITEVLLLILGGSLLLSCVDLLISSGWLPALYTKFWDTSFFMSNGGFLTPLVASFTGYRATPSLMDIIIYSIYWILIYFLLRSKKAPEHAT